MPLTQKFAYLFSLALGLSLLLYLLRGFQIITFMPGGILLGSIVISVVTFFLYTISITKR